jgi:hypothetical protein
MNPEKIVT